MADARHGSLTTRSGDCKQEIIPRVRFVIPSVSEESHRRADCRARSLVRPFIFWKIPHVTFGMARVALNARKNSAHECLANLTI